MVLKLSRKEFSLRSGLHYRSVKILAGLLETFTEILLSNLRHVHTTRFKQNGTSYSTYENKMETAMQQFVVMLMIVYR